MKKSRSINKILLSAHKMKYAKNTKFGQDATYRSTTMTPAQQKEHYMKIPRTLLSYNYVTDVHLPARAYGTSSLPPVQHFGRKNINSRLVREI